CGDRPRRAGRGGHAQLPGGLPTVSGVKIEIATTLTPAIVDAMERLVPQLSRSNPPPTTAELGEMVASPATDLFLAVAAGGTSAGAAARVAFPLPAGMRAGIEDVVVDQAAGRQGIGRALTEAMI